MAISTATTSARTRNTLRDTANSSSWGHEKYGVAHVFAASKSAPDGLQSAATVPKSYPATEIRGIG